MDEPMSLEVLKQSEKREEEATARRSSTSPRRSQVAARSSLVPRQVDGPVARITRPAVVEPPAGPSRAYARAATVFQRSLRKITQLRVEERERRRAANMPFEADTAGSRFKKVLRDALRVFPTKNPAALREAMQNDSSSEEGSDDDDDGFSDAGEEMALLVGESEGKARDAYRATCAEKLVLPSSRALVSFRAGACDVRSTHLGDRAVEALAAAVASHGRLAKLNLASNGVGPAGFDALAAGLAGAGHGLLAVWKPTTGLGGPDQT